MLRMADFQYVHARSYTEAADLWGPDSAYVAGGTDLLPNLKHRIVGPRRVIGIGGLRGEVLREGDSWVIGAGMRMAALARHPEISAFFPALAEAAGLVAGPQIRAMATLGGNVLLDTRCFYYNQTEFWRKSLGYCLKAEGDWCHVVGGPKTCVAAQSSDTVPTLLAYDARLRLQGREGTRELSIRELFRFNGMDHLKLAPGELLVAVVLPTPAPGTRATYLKLRSRGSIDFPQLGVAVVAVLPAGDSWLERLEIVIGAANPQPKGVRGLEAFCHRALGEAEIAGIGELVFAQTRPQASISGGVGWRRQMARVYTERALRALLVPTQAELRASR